MTECKTWDDLAVALNKPVRDVYRARKLAGAPGTKDVAAWIDYLKCSNGFSTEGLPPTAYDLALSTGKMDPDSALKHSRIVEQEIINEIKREELKKTRGEVIARGDVREKIEKVTRACIAAIEALPDLYAETLAPDQRAEGRKLARGWVDAIRQRMADGIGRA